MLAFKDTALMYLRRIFGAGAGNEKFVDCFFLLVYSCKNLAANLKK